MSIPERHLGLHMPGEAAVPADHAEQLGQLVEQHLDLDALLRMADVSTAASLHLQQGPSAAPRVVLGGPPVRIGLAQGPAFCFYYEE